MCCFTGDVTVSNTAIFAREAEGDRQHLIYSMQVKAKAAVAMVLPLPVPKGTGETAVTFVDLSAYPLIFTDLYNLMGFFREVTKAAPEAPAATPAPKPLVVHDVGSFEASFVPTIADFARLDERFRLPAGTWDKLPTYRDYGFAVFKLKPGEEKIHPMAFTFPAPTARHCPSPRSTSTMDRSMNGRSSTTSSMPRPTNGISSSRSHGGNPQAWRATGSPSTSPRTSWLAISTSIASS